VPGWFSPLEDGAWVVAEATYDLVGPWVAPLTEDLGGLVLRGAAYREGGLAATTRVLGKDHPVRWEGLQALGAFAIGATLDLAR
jgi:hypothetical protein